MVNWHPLGTIRHPLEGPGKQYVSLILPIFEANLRLPELFFYYLHILLTQKLREGVPAFNHEIPTRNPLGLLVVFLSDIF